MSNNETLRKFFKGMSCSFCNTEYNEENISIIRQEDDYAVLRLKCTHCEKTLGLAAMGICVNEENNHMTCENSANASAISYDDVVNAREFINSLGNDWAKYLPKI